MNHIIYLPVEGEIDEYFTNIFVNDNNLHDVIVEEYKNDKDVYKRQEHEREIVKVREDLNVTINQKLNNVSERVNVEVCLLYTSF